MKLLTTKMDNDTFILIMSSVATGLFQAQDKVKHKYLNLSPNNILIINEREDEECTVDVSLNGNKDLYDQGKVYEWTELVIKLGASDENKILQIYYCYLGILGTYLLTGLTPKIE